MDNQESKRAARVKRPERRQMMWREMSLEQLVPADHPVRAVWAYVDSLDLEPLYRKIKAVEGGVGRDAVDPRILLALWMFATIEGISSARQIARFCKRDAPYMWICGGVGVNYHLLSDFRVDHTEFLDELLADTIATLMHQNLVTLNEVAQDGMRVRASAGKSSFRREPTLERHREAAQAQVERLRHESEDDSSDHGESTKRSEAARERAARDREDRIAKALEELAEIQQKRERRNRGSGKEARSSTTDPEARNMKMAGGGFRPAYNVQFASDGESQLIVGVNVTNSGSDGGQMQPMHSKLVSRYGTVPDHYLVDGGFFNNQGLTQVEQAGSAVYAPIRNQKKILEDGGDPHARQPTDTDEVFAFRQRMATDSAKERYKRRACLAEYPNAVCRNHGLYQFRVRGLKKTKAVSLLHAIVFNFRRLLRLGWFDPKLNSAIT